MSASRSILCRLLALAAFSAAGSGLRAEPIISEFMAANTATLADEDGMYADWIELHNPDPVAVNLAGWYLSDSASNRTKWQFPAVTLQPGGYLVVFASNKNRTNAGAALHTNFALGASGEYLGLIQPDGLTVVSEFAPAFPAQSNDVSYGYAVTGGVAGFLAQPTPGAPNTVASNGGGSGLFDIVTFSRASGPFRNAFSLELSGAIAGQDIRFELILPNAKNNASDLTASSPRYTAPIPVAASVVVKAAVFSADGTQRGPVRSAYYSKLGASLFSFSSQLPVMVIDSLGSGGLQKDGIDHESWIYTYAPRSNNAPNFNATPDLISPLTASVRGASSAEFPKKGYNIKFTDELGNKRAQALLDLPAYERWALVAPWSFDFSYINNSFVYSLSNQMGRWAPRTRLAEVFFNANGDDVDSSDYAGIYVVTDRIEAAKGRVDVASLSAGDVSGPAVTGGYILKIDNKADDELGWVTQGGYPNNGYSSVVLVSPKADDVAPAQVDYIRDYVQRMENALFRDRENGWSQRTYLDYIDRGAWIDHHLLNTFVCNPDAFVRSAYFTKDRNGKLAAGPVWDFDRAIGSYWDERSFRYDVWSGVGGTDVWQAGWWGIIARDPEFMQDWVDRWQSLRRSELSTANLRSLIDSLAEGVGTAAANRDAARWPDNVSPWGGYEGSITRMKGWIGERARWIDQQFVAAPTVVASGGSIEFTPPAGAQLAYTLDGSDPRSLGGGIAPNAILTSTPLLVPASSNVHVRSYRADLQDVFPGSPWSSAVGGEESSPLSPRARLVNLSSRAAVGVGDDALIVGVVVADTESKRYLSRAVGPGLAAFGAAGVVPDPQLSIYGGNGVELFRNNGWEFGPEAARLPSYSRSVGAFPLAAGSSDSALASAVTAGNYTVQVTTPTGQRGVGLAELYELDGNGRTVNLSTRARVRTGDGVLIGGFVVQGPAYKRMLIRAVGPTLKAFGLTEALADPILTVYSGSNVVSTNDRWESSDNAAAVTAASQTAGAFALTANSQDAALLITLPPGAYTVEVKGKGETEGVALLEIYEVP